MRGPAGWGEFSPFREYGDAEAAAWWRAAREAAGTGWPRPVRQRVPVNATVPAVAAGEVASVLARFPGCTAVKVKVGAAGQPVGHDLERLGAVRDAVGPSGKVRVDANGAWDVETAARLLPRLDRAAGGLEYAEQPCRTTEELAALRRRIGIPVAADESIRRASDPLLVARLEAADVAVLKVQPLGGVRACLKIAERIRLPVVVSSALETSVGVAAGVALAAALPELPYACGLATVGLLERDVVADPLVATDGMLSVRRPVPHPAALAQVRPAREREAWWGKRVGRVSSLVPA